jgi:hypothetical protein
MPSSCEDGFVGHWANVDEGMLGFITALDALQVRVQSVVGHNDLSRVSYGEASYQGSRGFKDSLFAETDDLVQHLFDRFGGTNIRLGFGKTVFAMADGDLMQCTVPFSLKFDNVQLNSATDRGGICPNGQGDPVHGRSSCNNNGCGSANCLSCNISPSNLQFSHVYFNRHNVVRF